MIKLCEVNGISVFALNVNIFASQYIQIISQLNGLQNMVIKVFEQELPVLMMAYTQCLKTFE